MFEVKYTFIHVWVWPLHRREFLPGLKSWLSSLRQKKGFMKISRCVAAQTQVFCSTPHTSERLFYSSCICHVPLAVFQGGNEISRAMENTSYDIVSSLPEIEAYMERLQGSFVKPNQFLKEIKHPVLSYTTLFKDFCCLFDVGSYHALRSAIEALKARSPNLAWHVNGVEKPEEVIRFCWTLPINVLC